MLKRTVAMARPAGLLLMVGLLMVGVLSGPAIATEAPSHFREYEEIQENASDVGAEFLPAEYDIPGFFDWLIIPLVAAGVLITAAVLLRYLISHPRFEREAREKERSRR
ncbi:MAG TPA: hypothetical protein VMM13_16360 [Euzebya sp.]|nr:hypothetical protein [Euzebya sp.]